MRQRGLFGANIDRNSRGRGFGYDPVFYVPEVGQTFAQMPSELKQKLSHRGKAFANLQPLLKSLIESEGK